MNNPEHKTFEDMYETISKVIRNKKSFWKLDAIAWFDFEDVEQMIKVHIYNKWHLWDQSRSIEPWVNTIATNQIKNILRNNYLAYTRPCSGCPYNLEIDNSCSFTPSGIQCDECPLFAKWLKYKKNVHDIKMTSSLEHHSHYYNNTEDNFLDFQKSQENLNVLMKNNLSDKYYFIYKMIFIDHCSDEQVAEVLRLKTSEKHRKPGYRQIKNIKKMLYSKAAELIKNNDVI